MITKTVVDNELYGRCIIVKNDFAELLLSLDFGPRILSYKMLNGENVLLEDPDRKIWVEDKSIGEYYGGKNIWYNYGGSRFWVNPEKMPETFYPDSDKVDYELISNGAILIQKPQIKNNIQLSMKVELEDNSCEVTVEYSLTNIGIHSKELAIWGLTSVAPRGIAFVDTGDLFEDAAPNRSFTFWPYSDIRDKRLYLGKRFVTLKQELGNTSNPVNMGINAVEYAGYLNKSCLFIKKYDYIKNGKYSDLGSSFEMYSCDQYAEINSLGQYGKVQPQECITHREYLNLIKAEGTFDADNEDSIEHFIVKNIK